jgi:hypothetical protein
VTAWQRFWSWCSDKQGWQALAGVVYLVICVFDFVIVPAWIGINRVDIASVLALEQVAAWDPSVLVIVLEQLGHQHEPFTLRAGGLFHISFGAILTGSALAHNTRS